MPIKSGSTLVPLMGVDGNIVAYRLGSPSKSGMLTFLSRFLRMVVPARLILKSVWTRE